MSRTKKQPFRKIIFPVGIFLLLFLIESIVGAGSTCVYYYLSGRKNISDIEKYTINYSKTMAEAFARVAEFSYNTKKYSSLKTLFHQKIESDIIDEAFFILNDGKLIVHSNPKIENQLKGNIANDEMTYNLDLILQPLRQKSHKLFFSDYNILNHNIPFNNEEKNLIKDYVYSGINTNGWIFTKGVFIKNRPIGSVNFIISKERIHASILYQTREAKKYIAVAVIMAFIISLSVSIIVLIRYRTIQKKSFALGNSTANTSNITHPEINKTKDEPIILDNEYIKIKFLGEINEDPLSDLNIKKNHKLNKYIAPVIDAYSVNDSTIKDAIPIERKE